MKAVTAHTLLGVATRQSERLRHRRLGPMKGGIEAGDLRERRRVFRHRSDRCQILRLVQRRQRNERLQLVERSRIDRNRARETRASVDDAMPDRHDAMLGEHPGPAPAQQVLDRTFLAEVGPGCPLLLGNDVRARASDEAGPGRQPLELAMLNHTSRFDLVINIIDRVPKLQTRAAHLKEEMKGEILGNMHFSHEEGRDRPEIADWTWPG